MFANVTITYFIFSFRINAFYKMKARMKKEWKNEKSKISPWDIVLRQNGIQNLIIKFR